MGYETFFGLNVLTKDGKYLNDDSDVPIISEFVETYGLYSELDHHGGGNSWSTWDEYEEQLVEFSRNYPDYLFELTGRGEDYEDFWSLFVLNGRSYTEEAEITWPKFKPELLK